MIKEETSSQAEEFRMSIEERIIKYFSEEEGRWIPMFNTGVLLLSEIGKKKLAEQVKREISERVPTEEIKKENSPYNHRIYKTEKWEVHVTQSLSELVSLLSYHNTLRSNGEDTKIYIPSLCRHVLHSIKNKIDFAICDFYTEKYDEILEGCFI